MQTFVDEIAALSSGKVKRQISCLNSLLLNVSPGQLQTSISLINHLIDHGICSDNATVRAKSMSLVRIVYRVRSIRWGDVRNAISSELSSPDDPIALEETLTFILEMPSREMLMFMCSEDVTSNIRNICLLPNEYLKLRLCAIRRISDILQVMWMAVEGKPPSEDITTLESLVDAKRAKEDILDFIKEMYKAFANGVIGKAQVGDTLLKPDKTVSDLQSLTSAYSYAITQVLTSFMSDRRIQGVKSYVYSLLGLCITDEELEIIHQRSSFLPLIHFFLPTILENDITFLFVRWEYFESSVDLMLLIGNILMLLLKYMPNDASTNIGLNLNKAISAFDFTSNQDDKGNTNDARIDPRLVDIGALCKEWIQSNVVDSLNIANFDTVEDMLEVLYLVVEMIDDARLQDMQITCSPIILDTILECLHRYESQVNIDMTYCELVALGLKVLRYFPHGDINTNGNGIEDEWVDEEFQNFSSKRDDHYIGNDAEIAVYLIAFCQCINKIDLTLDVLKTRLLADLSLIILSGDGNRKPRSIGRVKLVLESSLMNSIVMNASPNSSTRQRLLCALCMTAHKMVKFYQVLSSGSVEKDTRHSASNSLDDHHHHDTSEDQKDEEEYSSHDLFDHSIKSSIIILKTFRRCLNWNVSNMHGEGGQLAYVELKRLIITIFLHQSEISSRLPVSLSSFLALLDEIMMYQMREHFPSRATKQEILLLLAEYSVRLSQLGPHFDLVRANDIIVSHVRSDLLMEEFQRTCNDKLKKIILTQDYRMVDCIISNEISANMLRAFKVIDVICRQHMHLLNDIYDIFQLLESRWDGFHTRKSFDREKMLFASLDVHTIHPTKTLMNPIVKEHYTLIKRRVFSIRKRMGNMELLTTALTADTSMHPYTDRMFMLDVFDTRMQQHEYIEEEKSAGEITVDGTVQLSLDIPPLLVAGLENDYDTILDYGAFTNCASKVHNGKIATTDIHSLIEDVLYPHFLYANNQRCLDLGKYYDPNSVYTDDNTQWKTISGSSDPLVVMGYLQLHRRDMTVTAHIRAINAAGFKIPSFSLQALISNQMNLNHVYVTNGVDYFLPGSMIERSFTFPVASFESVAITVRIIYNDLVLDHNDLAPIHLLADLNAKHSNNKGSKQQELFTSSVDCIPLVLPVHALLIPYGAGSLRLMTKWLTQNSQLPGIPNKVFRSIWNRLQLKETFPVHCTFELGANITMHGKLLELFRSGSDPKMKGTFEIDISYFADIGFCIDDDKNMNGVNVFGWAFQTLWGHEVALRMIIHKNQSVPNHVTDAKWSGIVEIKGTKMAHLQQMRKDSYRLMHALTSGLITCSIVSEDADASDSDSSLLALHNLQEDLQTNDGTVYRYCQEPLLSGGTAFEDSFLGLIT